MNCTFAVREATFERHERSRGGPYINYRTCLHFEQCTVLDVRLRSLRKETRSTSHLSILPTCVETYHKVTLKANSNRSTVKTKYVCLPVHFHACRINTRHNGAALHEQIRTARYSLLDVIFCREPCRRRHVQRQPIFIEHTRTTKVQCTRIKVCNVENVRVATSQDEDGDGCSLAILTVRAGLTLFSTRVTTLPTVDTCHLLFSCCEWPGLLMP